MKKITAYVNTTRVHWLVEELQAVGVGEIMVTEYFKPLSQISRLELLCQDAEVKEVKSLVHRIGTMGGPPPDHDVVVSQHDPDRLHLSPVSVRLTPLEESRLKQSIKNTFRSVARRLSVTFSVIALCIVCTALVLYAHIERVEHAAREANRNARVITDATNQIQTAHLEQLLAVERLHRGDMTPSPLRRESFEQQFKKAGAKLEEAALVLKQSHLFEQTATDSLVALESRFQSIVSSMFEIVTSLDRVGKKNNSAHRVESATEITRLSQSHDNIMAMLDALHLHSMEMLVSLEQTVSNLATRRENESEDAFRAVRLSLTILTALAFAITIAMWLVARQKVSHPIQVLVEEAKTLDAEGLK